MSLVEGCHQGMNSWALPARQGLNMLCWPERTLSTETQVLVVGSHWMVYWTLWASKLKNTPFPLTQSGYNYFHVSLKTANNATSDSYW